MNPVSQSNLTQQGRLPVIVRADGSEDIFKAREALSGLADGAEVTAELPIIDGFVAEISPRDYDRLMQQKPEGVQIMVDEKRQWIDPVIEQPRVPSPGLDVGVPTLGVDKLWARGYKGQGVTIAVIDTGIYPHPDLQGRILGFKDYVNGKTEAYDDNGHGTHVAGDAAGDGKASDGQFKGTAPEAGLVGIKVLSAQGSGRFSDIIKGVQWAVQNKERYHIGVINMSLGGPAQGSYKEDPVAQAVEKAMDAGILPVIAAGNSGPKASTVGTPGNDARVLTVGALDDANTVARDDDSVAKFSSRGPTKVDKLVKPDVLAPGVLITAASSPGSVLDKTPKVPHVGEWYITISGTSMATPVMAGIAADLISANPKVSPDRLKEIVMATADPLAHTPPYTPNDTGAGVVSPEKALAQVLAS